MKVENEYSIDIPQHDKDANFGEQGHAEDKILDENFSTTVAG